MRDHNQLFRWTVFPLVLSTLRSRSASARYNRSPSIGAVILVACSSALTVSCSQTNPAPEQVCAAPDTFRALTTLLTEGISGTTPEVAGKWAGARPARSLNAVSQSISFSMPVLVNSNSQNKLVACGALMTVKGNPASLSEAEKANPSISELATDHVSYRIQYTAQPSAEGGGKMVYNIDGIVSLAQAISDLALGERRTAGADVSSDSGNTLVPVDASQMGSPSLDDQGDALSAAADASADATKRPSQPVSLGGAREGMKYSEVRERLMRAGFRPIPRASNDDCDADGLGQCRFPETQTCSGGEEFCEYLFGRGSAGVTVVGKGDVDDSDPGAQTVTSISATQGGR